MLSYSLLQHNARYYLPYKKSVEDHVAITLSVVQRPDLSRKIQKTHLPTYLTLQRYHSSYLQ